MAKRGRTPGFVMGDEHRDKIRKSNILNALIEHAEGIREMSATQVSSGLGLLRKVLPDLASVEHSGTVSVTAPEQLTDQEVDAELAGLRALRGAATTEAAPPLDPSKLN